MNILGITLARGGSKGIPRKNIRLLNGLPLIGYTIKEALKSEYLDDYIVSTDDEEIKQVSQLLGASCPFLRPQNLAEDDTSSVDALKHAVNFMEEKNNITYDFVVELMCTNPLKIVDDINQVIKKIIETDADSVIAVHVLEDHHPIRIKKIVDDRIVDFCLPEKPESRRQDLKPNAYIRSGSIYALKRDHLMIDGRRYGSFESRPYILPPERAINVDTEVDFITAEHMIS